MDTIKTNERELASKIAQWFNEHIERNQFSFTSASAETGIKSTSTRFADIILWKDRAANQAFTYFELKPPYVAEDLTTFKEKAIVLGVKYAFTWDFQNLTIYLIEQGKIEPLDVLPTPILSKVSDWLIGSKQAELKAWIRRICEELERLQETGKLTRFTPEKIYFINLIRGITAQLIPGFEVFIRDAHKQGINKPAIDKYVVEQGITYPSDNEFYSIIARQRVHGLVTKIIFYLTVRRYFTDLPDLIETDESDLNRTLKVAFAEAAKLDWQAVFMPDPIEDLGIPDAAQDSLRLFFSELKVYHFGELKEDVVGELFEEIIDPSERHRLGQYFTREDLVDFVIAAVVNDKDGIYSDPTCGSGTFLIRLYDRLKYLSKGRKTHAELLNQIWGIDIGKFPAELSTINLFRQDVRNFENFPRIINRSVFDVHTDFVSEFPPPHAGLHYKKIKVGLPAFNAFVGNFPFIRQELIEKKDRGFKIGLTKLLAEEYFLSYPVLFEIKNPEKNGISHLHDLSTDKQISEIHRLIDEGRLSLKLSGQADIYTYIYIHLTTLLARNGSFAIITSNSWLDASYGAVLKQFFLDHFHIRMVVASWAEPWFDDASVNTVITVLDRKISSDKAQVSTTKFVKLKKPFHELVPYRDLQVESIARWDGYETLIRTIETAEYSKQCKPINDTIAEYESDEMRIRVIEQDALRAEVAAQGESSKWGKYLRAPKIYFELVKECKTKTIPINKIGKVLFGIKTGINEFFYLEKIETDAQTGKVTYRNDRGWQGVIEEQYLKAVIKSPKESVRVNINKDNLKYHLFICNKSKKELRKTGDIHTLRYIEWGEKQKTKESQNANAGVPWTKVPSVSSRENWYDLGINEYADIIIPCGIGDTFKVFSNDIQILNDKRLYEIYLKKKNPAVLALLNSTLFALFIESESRVNLGDGLIDLSVYEVEQAMIPDPKLLDKKITKALTDALEEIAKRDLLPISKEVKQKDRRVLDAIVLKALGLDPDHYLPRMYDALSKLVAERIELPKMRKKHKKDKERFSYEEVKQSVIRDVIPHGVHRFPAAFWDEDISKITTVKYSTTGLPLHTQVFFDQIQVKDSEGTIIFTTTSPCQAAFAIAVAKESIYQLAIPTDDTICQQIMSSYKTYYDKLKLDLENNAQMKLHDWNIAEKMTIEILLEMGMGVS